MITKISRQTFAVAAVLFFLSAAAGPLQAQEQVKAWKDTLTVPTYLTGRPERNPFFYFGRAYQGAKGPVYPYPMLDTLTDIRRDQAYTALFLENSYVQYCVLPEVGGRIFYAVDKSNGYDFIFRQHVIKPALIGMLGAWISGGAEWNIPHHHRASTFRPVDAVITDNPDGSKTVWAGELELRHRMRWEVGMTLFPNKSVLQVTFRISNRTPLAHSILCWANVAAHATPDYQVIFPPGTEVATFHAKNQFSRWPVSGEVYNGVDYRPATDVSWWKNNPSPTSFFAWDSKEDFLAGYDHGRDSGVVFVADHNLVPGKKFWTWGTGSEGSAWEKILTDSDGPYLELMFGAFSDNQPDYSWCRPYEVKTVKEYWYPIHRMAGVKAANERAALNLEIEPSGRARISLNVTEPLKGTRIVIENSGRVLFEDRADLFPERFYQKEVALPEAASAGLRLRLCDAAGVEVAAYTSAEKKDQPLPKPVAPPPAPADIKTIEELYLTGQRLEQFYNPALEPYPYYQEALKRDPDESRVNTALGRLALKRGLYGEAEACFKRAVSRISKDYTRPRQNEPLYDLGLTLRARGRTAEAADAFNRAAWDAAWEAPSLYQLAELECGQGDFSRALEHIGRSLAGNGLNSRALMLKAVLLQKLGRSAEAEKTTRGLIESDPLDPGPRYFLRVLRAGSSAKDAATLLGDFRLIMRDDVQNYLELASDYASWGLWREAGDVLLSYLETRGQKSPVDPLVYYSLGFYSGKLEQPGEERRWDDLAAAQPPDYCFPFRLEDVEVLRRAEAVNPGDSRAPYYLGNLLFDLQPEAATAEWAKSAALNGTFATVHRNLGLAQARLQNDLPAAVRSLEKAVACDKTDARLFYELDLYSQAAGIPPEKRLAVLQKNHPVVAQRDDALAREVSLLVELGHAAQALDLLRGHHFHVWEGGGEIHGLFVEACLERGQDHFRSGRFKSALSDFEAALEYPQNLEAARPSRGGDYSRVFYFIGTALEALGEKAKAADHYAKASAPERPFSEVTYYQALAWQKLGRADKAASLFAGLEKNARDRLASSEGLEFFAKFGERRLRASVEAQAQYILGLALLGQGREAEAQAAFKKALDLDPELFQVRKFLKG